jgi:hypothetical protein
VQTPKDQEVVAWIGGLGAAGAEHVMARFAMGRSWAYARLSKLVADGLLQQHIVLYRQPGLYVATRDGLRWCGLERLGVFSVSPGAFRHACEVARVAAALHARRSDWRILGERELRAVEADEGRLLGSIKLGDLPGGRPALHRPDLLLISPSGEVLAVEVELSIKAPRRLAGICRAWARARHIDHVVYLADAGTARAVGRAVREVRADERITMLPVSRPEAILAGRSEEVDRVSD